MQFKWKKETQSKELIGTIKNICSEPKFSIGEDFPNMSVGILKHIPGNNLFGNCMFS